jgi:hypothetical protein
MKAGNKAPMDYEGSRSKIIALSGVLSAVVAFLTFWIIPAAIPLGGFDSSSILILSLPIILGPELGTIIVCAGEFIGTIFLLAVFGGPLFFLPGIVAVRGPEAYFVGKIARTRLFGRSSKKGKELFATVIGPIWETIGFMVADYYIYYLFLGSEMALVYTLIVGWTIIDLIWVIPAVALTSAIRASIKTDYMDRQMGLEGDDRTKRRLFRTSAAFIVICWVLLLLVPFVFTNWFSA